MVINFWLVELSKAQDIEAGNGTTTVLVLAGSFLGAASRLIAKDMRIEPMQIVLLFVIIRAFILRR